MRREPPRSTGRPAASVRFGRPFPNAPAPLQLAYVGFGGELLPAARWFPRHAGEAREPRASEREARTGSVHDVARALVLEDAVLAALGVARHDRLPPLDPLHVL